MDEKHADDPNRLDLLAQWRNLWQQLGDTTGRLSGGIGHAAAALPSLPGLPRVPWPGALSAAQMAGITSAVHAQRETIRALQSQLAAFDQQLGVLQQLVEPLTELTATWARIEGAVGGGGAPPTAGAD